VDAAKVEELQAEVYDVDAAKVEGLLGLEPFRQTEEVIYKACRVAPIGRFLWNVSRKHPLLEIFTTVVLKGNPATKLVDIEGHHRMLLKFMTECFFQKGGGSDQPSVDHKPVLYFLAAYEKINLPRYLMHHLCWAIKEGIRGKRKQIPCGRLLSEIFTQGKLLETLRRHKLASDKTLRTVTGKIINGKTLQNMKIIKKFSPNEKDLKESAVQTKLMRDFPPISKEENSEVLAELIAAYAKESGGIILDDDTPDIPDEAPLRVRGKRAKSDDGSEAVSAQTKKPKKDKSEASNLDSMPAPAPKRKRGKGESSMIKDATIEAYETNWDAEVEEPRAKKTQLTGDEIVSPMFIMTPEMSKRVDEHAKKLLEEKKKKKEEYLAAWDARLKSIGLEGCDEFYVQKLAEVKKIAETVEQETVKQAKEMLEQIQGSSEAGASEAAPESATVAEASEASAKMIQISELPIIIPPPLSPSNDSDHNEMPLGQRMKMLPKPQQTTKQTPLQEEQSSAAAEGSEDPEEPNTSDLPQCDSPSNMFSLERHLGGEISKTPQKATKSVPKKIDLVNQQTPQPTLHTTLEPSSTQIQIQTPQQTQTPTPTQTHTSPLQMIIPEHVVETVAAESVLVTESEPSVSITISEPTQKLPLTTNDQPSSSSSPSIQILEQPPSNLLESEYIEAELLQISKEMQELVKLRKAPTLSIVYEDRWVTLKTRAYDLLNSISQKCIRIQAAAVKRYFKTVHSAEETKAPLLFLANAPFYPQSDYVSREAKMFKLLKQKVLKQQEDSTAREDLLLQRQLALEATLKQQAALIEQLINKQINP